VSTLNQNANLLTSLEQNFPVLNFTKILTAILEVLKAHSCNFVLQTSQYLSSGQLKNTKRWYSKHTIIILPDNYGLPLRVGSFIVLTQRTQPTAHTRGGVAAGGDKR
jgi:hypothetical protein